MISQSGQAVFAVDNGKAGQADAFGWGQNDRERSMRVERRHPGLYHVLFFRQRVQHRCPEQYTADRILFSITPRCVGAYIRRAYIRIPLACAHAAGWMA